MHDLHVVIITGLSGAGKSHALRAMEDIDFFCVDNLPPAMLQQFLFLLRDTASGPRICRVAVCIDVRVGIFFNTLLTALEQLSEEGILYEILYLDASEEALVRRFKETRRPHPLAPQGRVQEGIQRERQRMEPVRNLATRIIDTSQLSPHQLKAQMRETFTSLDEGQGMLVNVLSFGFKYGIPEDADLVFDVRFLPNPHWVAELRPLSGQNQDVYEYVMQQPITESFLTRLREMLSELLPYYAKEGKSQLVVAIGCTGGRHRSVAIAVHLADYLKDMHPRVHLEHRDLEMTEREERNN